MEAPVAATAHHELSQRRLRRADHRPGAGEADAPPALAHDGLLLVGQRAHVVGRLLHVVGRLRHVAARERGELLGGGGRALERADHDARMEGVGARDGPDLAPQHRVGQGLLALEQVPVGVRRPREGEAAVEQTRPHVAVLDPVEAHRRGAAGDQQGERGEGERAAKRQADLQRRRPRTGRTPYQLA
jgi:hypothetical protein